MILAGNSGKASRSTVEKNPTSHIIFRAMEIGFLKEVMVVRGSPAIAQPLVFTKAEIPNKPFRASRQLTSLIPGTDPVVGEALPEMIKGISHAVHAFAAGRF